MNLEQESLENELLKIGYWDLFKKHGSIFHALILIFSIIIIVVSIVSVINSPGSHIESFGWIALMSVVIERVFAHLKKKANITTSENKVNIVEPLNKVATPKNFWNYFALILFVINIILLIMFFLYVKNYSGEGGWVGFGGLIIHFSMILSSIPFVVLTLLNKGKTFNNITAAFFLLPPIIVSLFILYGKLLKFFS